MKTTNECRVEQWRPVVGYEGLYEVSNKGRVRSLPRKVEDKNGKRVRNLKGKLLTNVCSNTGYHMVSLHKNNNRQERRTVHRLIAEAWMDPPPSKDHVIDHIDGVRSHNDLKNLRWATHKSNNNNTPYIRYLMSLLEMRGIEFMQPDEYERFNDDLTRYFTHED